MERLQPENSMWYTNTLKWIVLIIAIFTIINTSKGQSYSHSPNDTIIANANFDFFGVYNITQLHPTNDTLFFNWHKQTVVMPATWEASICDNGHCNTSLVDSGSMDPVYVGDIGLMSLHLNPHFEPGTAIIRYTIYETSTPSQVDTLTWIITATGATGTTKTDYVKPLLYIQNQTLYLNHIDKRFAFLKMMDLNGQIIFSTSIQDNKLQYQIPFTRSPLAIVQLSGPNISHQQKINIYAN